MNQTHKQTYEAKAGLVEVIGFDVAGISLVTDHTRATEDINALWERFFAQRIGQQVENKADDIIYAVYSDYAGDHTQPYRVTIGYRLKTPPAPHIISLQGGTAASFELHYVKCKEGPYAVLSAGGKQPEALIESWNAIWSSDLDRAFQTDFEMYGPRFFEDGVHEVLLHIGIHT